MKTLSMDIETYSDIDLQKSGVYAYTASNNFQILLFAYAFGGEEVKVIDLANGEGLSDEIVNALVDEGVVKTAFNANFERICLSEHLNMPLSPVSWRCTAVQSASLGLPLTLEGVSQVLNLKEQKLREGKELIKFFSMPCAPTLINGGRSRNLPQHDPEGWQAFKSYCKRDVEVERAIRSRLERYSLSDYEQRLYELDQQINDRGVLVDRQLVRRAMECDRLCRERALFEAQRLSGLKNPNSVQQLKGWLLEKGVKVDSMSRKVVLDLAKDSEGEVERILSLRLKLSKTSIKKYEAIERSLCPDGRVRGLLQFYGANRTGRWAGRLVQVQNLPQNHLEDLEGARDLVKRGDFESLEMFYESVPQVLSELVRTAFIPRPKHEFIVADFNAIEARVIAWLAGEGWRIGVFETHGKIYEASASRMFGVPIEEITKTSPLRQKGKIAELALGYGGSVGALRAMGALDMGLKEEELLGLVTGWRSANPNIVKLWWDVGRAAIKSLSSGRAESVSRIRFRCENGILFITLPSGRRLSYLKPKITTNEFGQESLSYEGIGTNKKWERIETYGPKLVENIVQAIARDILAAAMLRVSEKGYRIIMHVHDELVVECEVREGTVKDVCDLMSVVPSWAGGLPLGAEGFACEFYRK